MNKVRGFTITFILIIALIILHNNILALIGNITTLFKVDNRTFLQEEMYKTKIESLEKQLLEYEKSYENLKIYEGETYILSKIALRDIYDFYNYLIITSDVKIKEGSAVINEHGLVGIIKSVDNLSAKVSLITGKEKISVKISSSYGLIDGYDKKNKLLIVRNINNYENIEVGSIVTTSGLSELPGDIKVGIVKEVEKKGIEQFVYVESAVDYDNLNYLYVIDK